MRWFQLILAFIFFLFAFVQLNDPDPWIWVLLYGYMMVICILGFFKKLRKSLLWIPIVLYSIYAALFFPSFWQWITSPNRLMLFDEVAKMQNIFVEETREFLGLMICLIVLIAQLLVARSNR